jgi:hypothetical protein
MNASLIRITNNDSFRLSLRMITGLTLCCLTLGCSTRTAPQSSARPDRITLASGVRVRAAPQSSAQEIARLPLGVTLQTLEQSASKEKIGESEDYWYRVSTADGKTGWVFGGLTAPFVPEQREEIYQRIAAEKLKNENAEFAEQADLASFLTRAVAEVRTPAVAAELELARLVALERSLSSIPSQTPEQPAQRDWLKRHEEQIVYSEPGGMWLVKLDLFWTLQKKYSALPVAERIAWAGAQNELPGECEGYLPCGFERIMLSEGKYLALYPQGAHAEEALEQIDEMLKSVIEDAQSRDRIFEVPKEDRASFARTLTRLRAVLAETSSAKTAVMLKRLEQIARLYR